MVFGSVIGLQYGVLAMVVLEDGNDGADLIGASEKKGQFLGQYGEFLGPNEITRL